jgi:transposase-like protein
VGEITREFDIHQNLVYKWTQECHANPASAFRGSIDDDAAQTNEQRIADLERSPAHMTLENELSKKALSHAKTILALQNRKDCIAQTGSQKYGQM